MALSTNGTTVSIMEELSEKLPVKPVAIFEVRRTAYRC
jgi:hypothetical protein